MSNDLRCGPQGGETVGSQTHQLADTRATGRHRPEHGRAARPPAVIDPAVDAGRQRRLVPVTGEQAAIKTVLRLGRKGRSLRVHILLFAHKVNYEHPSIRLREMLWRPHGENIRKKRLHFFGYSALMSQQISL